MDDGVTAQPSALTSADRAATSVMRWRHNEPRPTRRPRGTTRSSRKTSRRTPPPVTMVAPMAGLRRNGSSPQRNAALIAASAFNAGGKPLYGAV
jgi:hypothetical protein